MKLDGKHPYLRRWTVADLGPPHKIQTRYPKKGVLLLVLLVAWESRSGSER